MELKEIENQKRALEYQQAEIKRDLKHLTTFHHAELVKECVKELLDQQEKKGKLDQFDIQVSLQELTSKIRGLYEK